MATKCRYLLFFMHNNTDDATLRQGYTNKREALKDAKQYFKFNYKSLEKGEGYAVIPTYYNEDWECYDDDWSNPLYYEYKK